MRAKIGVGEVFYHAEVRIPLFEMIRRLHSNVRDQYILQHDGNSLDSDRVVDTIHACQFKIMHYTTNYLRHKLFL